MAITTPKLSLPKPASNENVTLVNYQALIDAIDTNAVGQAEKGAANGVATLDASGTIPDAQIPAAVTRDTELAAHTSRTDNPHQVTASQAGALVLGANNQALNKVVAAELKTDTRTTVLTYTGSQLTKVEEKDGATVVKTTNLAYDGSGNLTQVQEIAGGTTVTTTLTYTSGQLTSVSKAVL